MAAFNKEELYKIAQLSAVTIDAQECDLFVDQIKTILSYVDQLQSVPLSHEAARVCNINVMREDIALPFDSEAILDQAPQRNDRFFVVPTILEDK